MFSFPLLKGNRDALGTVSFHTLKVALANPVKALRSE